MTPRLRFSLGRLAILGGVLGLQLCAVAQPAGEPVVALPPMVIEEEKATRPWLYVQDDGTEYLSRCTERITRDYVAMRRERMAWVRALIPEALFFRTQVPFITVLASQQLNASGSKEVVNEVVNSTRKKPSDGGFSRSVMAPNMMLDDADSVGIFAFIDEPQFKAENLTVATDYLRLLMGRRTPVIPVWLSEGLLATYNSVAFSEPAITLSPLVWLSPDETRRLVKDDSSPRTLLPPGELMTNPRQMPIRLGIARAQCALFVRWALDPKNGVQEPFRRFVARACEEPVTEPMFESCFGFGFSDLRDRLSDYLPTAVKTSLRLDLPAPARPPRLDVRKATPGEVARLRGEWERLTVGFVRARFPAAAGRYVGQARQTLHRAYDEGDHDPRLITALALCEIDAGDAKAARPLLEAATAAKVVRPRIYTELARLKWTEIVTANPNVAEYTFVEVTEVAHLLQQASAQAPALAETYDLLAALWQRSPIAPTPDDLKRIARDEALFAADSALCLRLASALARHGLKAEAVNLLGTGFLYARNDQTRQEFAKAYSALQKPK